MLARMRKFRVIILGTMAAVLCSCGTAPVEYATDASGGNLHWISTDPAEIFRHKIDRQADLEARGIEPPIGNASWREYWMKLIDYYASTNEFGSRREVAAYVVQQRRARGLSPL